MHRIRVIQPRYDQCRPYVGRVGEVIGRWSAETNRDGREGYLVQFPDGKVVGVADDEVVDVVAEF